MRFIIAFLALAATIHAKPNIVYILADDLGYGDVGVYNPQSKIPTPNLDRLAKQGVRFTDAHAPSSVCTPTRYAILTGRLAWRSPLKTGVLGPWDKPLIEKDRLTIASFLKQNGYHTSIIGKWHLGLAWPTKDGHPPTSCSDRLSNVDFTKPIGDGPTTRGFHDYFGVDIPNYPPYVYIQNDRTLGIPSEPNRPEYNRPGPMLPGWDWVEILPELTRRAVSYVEAESKKATPYFLYFPLTSPHYPIVPSPEFRGKSGAGDYGDFVVQTDFTVGQILDAIERSGQAENTLVIFTSDNGPERTGEINPGGYDRVKEFSHNSSGELRGLKRDLWEGGHRVPFIASWPGKIKAGTIENETISHVDLFATAAAIIGEKVPANAAPDSFNILPALLGEERKKPLRPATIHHGINGALAIRKGDWVLIDAPTGDNNREPQWRKDEWKITAHNQPSELFNLKDDPQQHRNLYAENPEQVRKLKALLDHYRSSGRTTIGPDLPNDPPAPNRQSATRTNASREGPWKSGDLLVQNDAPQIAGKSFTITATISPGEGVILAQGGARHGYTLFVKNKQLTFAVRVNGTLSSVSTPAPDTESKIEASLTNDGTLTINVTDQKSASFKASGLIPEQPGDPLSIGRDLASPVGDYDSPNPFQGTVEHVTLTFPQP